MVLTREEMNAMDTKFENLKRGDTVTLETSFVVEEVNPRNGVTKLRNLRNNQVTSHTAVWFMSLLENGFTSHIVPKSEGSV